MFPPYLLLGQFYAANVTGLLQSGEFPVNQAAARFAKDGESSVSQRDQRLSS
jgi:hypothetical protein